ncbi:hypothetical protein P5673_032336 [Acropora cervicornis]|uniref:Uncharacterized protein n=1 Tax=Acropora cervicornis TaxID=6130 RepID=A0AAD9US05_ACRCE|nr:hypothetical protein P5673_032336 [Acropora cervicornis]
MGCLLEDTPSALAKMSKVRDFPTFLSERVKLKWDTRKKRNGKKYTVWKRYTASLGLRPDADEASPRMVLRSHLGIVRSTTIDIKIADVQVFVFKILENGYRQERIEQAFGRISIHTHPIHNTSRTSRLCPVKKNTYANVRNIHGHALLNCSKVVIPIKLLARTISHMLSSTLYSHVLIDEYTPPVFDVHAVLCDVNSDKEKFKHEAFINRRGLCHGTSTKVTCGGYWLNEIYHQEHTDGILQIWDASVGDLQAKENGVKWDWLGIQMAQYVIMLHTCTFQSMYTISILSPSGIFLHIPCDVKGATHYMEYILYVTVVRLATSRDTDHRGKWCVYYQIIRANEGI